mgnify:CR=1 FL=1
MKKSTASSGAAATSPGAKRYTSSRLTTGERNTARALGSGMGRGWDGVCVWMCDVMFVWMRDAVCVCACVVGCNVRNVYDSGDNMRTGMWGERCVYWIAMRCGDVTSGATKTPCHP